MSRKEVGPDLTINPGQVGEIHAESYIDGATGRTYRIAGGGILIVRILPGIKAASSGEWTDARKAAVRKALNSWARDKGKKGLRYWSDKAGATWEDMNAAIFNASRVPQELRTLYLESKCNRARMIAEQERIAKLAKKGL